MTSSYEHIKARRVMETVLGRELTFYEHVHHKNLNPSDNQLRQPRSPGAH